MCDRLKCILGLLVALLLSACQGEDSVSRDYRCVFVFDTTLHPLPCQLTAIVGNSGHFVMVELQTVGGVRHLKTTRNYDGATEDIMLRTERERLTTLALGAANCIVIGRSSYDNRMVAYDGQCPNCVKDYGGVSYPLAWENAGLHLACRKCKRAYDVNNGVPASGSGGRQLMYYNADFDGTLLRAWN